jgi:hypothetical protein
MVSAVAGAVVVVVVAVGAAHDDGAVPRHHRNKTGNK